MPSHSKKQHNFMEAIAHSPSFAKKVHIPQSVGKDYVAADKGKTFGKGDNMKRMAFGGETASDKKAKTRLANMREEDAEVAEGRQKQQREDRLERYRRNISMDDLKAAQKQGKTYDKWFEDNRKAQLKEGILRQDAYDEGKGYEMLTPTQHRQALTSSGMKKGGEVKESKAMVGKEVAFMKKKGAPAKMIKHEMSEMKGMKRGGRVRKMAEGGLNDMGEGAALSNRSYGYEEEKERGAKNLEGIKNFFGFGKKKDEEAAPIDRSRDKPPPEIRPSMSGPSTSSGRVSSQSPRTRRENEDTSDSDAVEREDAASMDRTTKGPQFISSIAKDEGEYSGDGLSPAKGPSTPNRKPRTVSVEKNKTKVTASSSGSGPTEYERELEERKRRLNSEKLLKDAEEEVLRKKPTAMTEQMRKAPTIRELYKGQKSMGEEIGDVLKSFRETIRGGLQKGKERQESKGSTMYAKGGNVKRMRYGGEPDSGMDMGQPMRGTPMGSPQMPMEDIERRKAKMAGMPNAAAAMGAAAVAKMRARTGMGFDEGQGYGNRGPQPTLPPRPIEPPMMEDKVPPMPKRPDGEMVPRSPIEPPPKEPKGLPGQTPEELIQEKNRRIFNSEMTQPSRPGGSPQIGGPGIKAGGQVKKMAQGGYAKADGVAKKGKTQGKVVKMAKGGFVKTADGCAQRGKTKAFQVKMKRGGMC